MAKLGLEVEGKYAAFNLKTLFMSAEEYMEAEDILDIVNEQDVEQLYISDHLNLLDLNDIGRRFADSDVLVTVELTQLDEVPPEGIEIYWNASQASYAQAKTIRYLRSEDQVKVECAKHVMSWVVGEAVLTFPEDFDGDVEL